MGAAFLDDPGDNRLSRRSTIMGLAVLTAVFGMGTGVTPPVWSPEKWPAGGQARPATVFSSMVASHTNVAIFAYNIPERALRSHCPIAVPKRGSEPIGVVKLLGC